MAVARLVVTSCVTLSNCNALELFFCDMGGFVNGNNKNGVHVNSCVAAVSLHQQLSIIWLDTAIIGLGPLWLNSVLHIGTSIWSLMQ